MSDQRVPGHPLELPPLEDVERGLGLAQPDRSDLPSLYRMNVARLPLIRTVGFMLALGVLAVRLRVLGVEGEPGRGSVFTVSLQPAAGASSRAGRRA